MKRILFAAVLVCFGFSAFAGNLEISVTPQNPLLIPVSSTVGATGPVTPYFSLNSLKMTWKGSTSFQLMAVVIAGEKTYACGGSGSTVNASLFWNAAVTDCKGNVIQPAIDANLNVTIPAVTNASCPYTVESSNFYCDNLPVAVLSDPMASYNIPARVTVTGETFDASGNPNRVIATENIVIK